MSLKYESVNLTKTGQRVPPECGGSLSRDGKHRDGTTGACACRAGLGRHFRDSEPDRHHRCLRVRRRRNVGTSPSPAPLSFSSAGK